MINQIVKVEKIRTYQTLVYKNGIRTFPKKEYHLYNEEITNQLKKDVIINEEKPIKLEIGFNFIKPKSWSKKKKEEVKEYTTFPDLDNAAKAVIDILSKFYNFNDKNINDLKLTKKYTDLGNNYIVIKLEQE